MNRRKLVSIVAGILAFILILSLLLSILPAVAHAADAQTLKQELESLKEEAEEIHRQRQEVETQQSENEDDIQALISRKNVLDEEIKLIHDQILNIRGQIDAYNLLITQSQQELDEAESRRLLLESQYEARICAMEKNSHTSYWSVLFQSKGFADFVGRIRMMADIARADRQMLDELKQAAQQVDAVRIQMESEKAGLAEQRLLLESHYKELEIMSAQSAEILGELNANAWELEKLHEEYARKEAELSSQIAKKEQEYTESQRDYVGAPAQSGWLYPLPYRVPITDAYGWRNHVITGKYSFHHGVDFAAPGGTAIYASRSGTVTDASDSEIYGWNVTINHGDGFSSLYAHMTHYVVSAGDYVEQGEIIGYVGSTGWSSGNHLHFSIYYNGDSVNPMNYVG